MSRWQALSDVEARGGLQQCRIAVQPRARFTSRRVLIPVWMIFVVFVIQPESLMQEPIMPSPVLWWGVGPLVVVAAVVGWQWHVAAGRVQPAPVHRETPAAERTEQATREYVLEVISLGVTLDKYRQGALWDALARGRPQAFDGLPTLGFLHRPVFVKTVDDQGEPLSRRDPRAAALAAGWQQAVQTLPESERKTAPARVVTSTGGNVEQTIAWTTVMNQWAAQGGPELDKSQSTKWIDTDARLGNTGAATLFMQMAIGVMGSQREGGVSAAVNLRDPREASIVMISPPPEDKRLKQQSRVFESNVTPSIDPENYK